MELRGHNTLGRHPSNTIQLLDKIVSKEHCIIDQHGNGFILKDLGSLNGTYINGQRVVGQQVLNHGDDIALGSTRARYDDGSGLPQSMLQPGAGAGAAAAAPSAPQPPAQPPAWQPAAPVAPAGPSSMPHTHQAPQPQFQPVAGPSGTAPMPAAPGISPVGGVPDLSEATRTRVDVSDQARAIGTQIAATQKGFLPHAEISGNQEQLAADYERLRLSYELSREIALEPDLPSLLNKILMTMFKFVRADRGVIFLMSEGQLLPGASLRRDGTNAPIKVSSTILNHVVKERATALTHDAAMDFAASKGKSMILNRISSAIVAPLLHNDEILGVLWLDSESLAQFQQKDMEVVTSIAGQAAMFIEMNNLARKIEQEIVARERFSRLLSPNVAEKVMSGELDVKQGGHLVKECTVYNSDIRGFTTMSEGANPEQIVDMLNEYFEHMVECLFKYDGTLDKFMGDGIMALWGAPVVQPDDAERSVACALEQMELLGQFNRGRMDKNLPPLAVGIGIHSGPVVAGYIGSSKALSYTVIGDTANTSARLCGVATSGQILVSEATLNQLSGKFEYEELPAAKLKGKEKPFKRYNIVSTKASAQVPASATP